MYTLKQYFQQSICEGCKMREEAAAIRKNAAAQNVCSIDP